MPRRADTTSLVTIGDGLERLRAVPLFADLPEPTLKRVAAAAAAVEIQAGQTLVRQHDPGSGMYVIEEGTVLVDLHGRSIELGPGEFFGELSLLVPDATRSANVRATTPVRCLAFARSDFTSLVESEPALALGMLRLLARRLLDEIESR